MAVFAYCRVSTMKQSSMLQEEAILKAYPEAVVRHEQKSGIAKAKRERPEVYSGRKPSINGDEVKRLLLTGMKANDVAKAMSISRSSVYLYKNRFGL